MENFKEGLSDLKDQIEEMEELIETATELAEKDMKELESFSAKAIKKVLKEKHTIIAAVAKEMKAQKLLEHTKEINRKVADLRNEFGSQINTINKEIQKIKKGEN